MSPTQVIVLATPVFFLLIAIEFFIGRHRAAKGTGKDTYRLNDTINSISLGVMSQLVGPLSRLLSIGIYTLVFDAVAIYPDLAFWQSGVGFLVALVFYDFCYYWLHRAGHVVSLFWAAHVVHHQSQQYNLSTALRQTSSGVLLSWVFYIPMAVAGVPPLVFGIVALIDLLYQFWVHTEQVGKLGWFDRVFCSPSNHRVHHAVNTQYLDKNYGGILVLWDRMFGSYAVEEEKCVYGTRGQLNSWDPLWANGEVYTALARDSWRTRRWVDKIKLWFMPPGWQPADLAAAHPKPEFQLAAVTTYNPPLTAAQQWFAAAQFVVTLGAVSVFLWHADTLTYQDAALWCTALVAGIWATGRFMQGQLSMLEVLMVESAALATLSALGMLPGHLLFKPLTLGIAIAFVAAHASSTRATATFGIKNYRLLLAALVFSLAGDVWLMLPGNYFIPGLASFLVAHVFYIALLRQGQGWFPNRRALGIVAAVGAGMYAIVWPGLGDPVLKMAVAAYVTVIACMAAQALGRASMVGDSASRWVAAGACVFMVSDSLIAINKFVAPVPLAPLWILATYYLAQMLIVHNVLASRPDPHRA
jgi:alkylglycerol monooxygenase